MKITDTLRLNKTFFFSFFKWNKKDEVEEGDCSVRAVSHVNNEKSDCNYFTGLQASTKLWNLNILIFNAADSFFAAAGAVMNIKYVWQTHFPIRTKSVRCRGSLQRFRLFFTFFLINGFLQTICYHRRNIFTTKTWTTCVGARDVFPRPLRAVSFSLALFLSFF